MKELKLIKKIHMECPLCDKIHEVDEMERTTTLTIKGEKVIYNERFYFCANSDEDENEFETGGMMNKNLLNARNAYRKKKGLLTSDEIVAIRESYGLSQVDLAKLLGWGEATISRYESKAIQDEAYDMMLRLVKDDPLKAMELLSYLAQSMSYFYKVKLMKSLWYSDVLYYKKTGKSMTGLVYRHDRMGALPVGHYSLMNLEKLNVCEEISQNDNSMLHVYPCLNVDYSILTKEEKSVLDDVINKFKDFKASEIVDYMHEEMAYRETKDGEIIPFSLAKNIREFSLTN